MTGFLCRFGKRDPESPKLWLGFLVLEVKAVEESGLICSATGVQMCLLSMQH